MPDASDPRLTPPPGPGQRRQVRTGALAIRAAPDTDSEMVTQALHGETLRVFAEAEGFAHVQLDRDRYVGWADPTGLSASVRAPTHVASSRATHAYARADLKSPPRLALSLGAYLHVDDGSEENGFLQCEGAGWVHHRHLRTIDAPSDDPAGIAERFIGAPYLWGGRTSGGLDCTGLTVAAFGACGVTLPRDSDMQYAWAGAAIETWQSGGALMRGDLVFWKGHVGIMLDAARLIHANAHHMAVAAEPLDEAIARIAPLYGNPIGAKRIDLAAARAVSPDWLETG